MIAAGFTNMEIGKCLGITARTVRVHTDAVKAKLKIEHRRHIPQAYAKATGISPYPKIKPLNEWERTT
jgi:DNA-binding CsgD family transcriptional regulator